MERTIKYATEIVADVEESHNVVACALFELVSKATKEGYSLNLNLSPYGISVTNGRDYLGPIICRTAEEIATATKATIAYIRQEENNRYVKAFS